MILPTKHVHLNGSLLGVGARVLQGLQEPQTVSRLWERLRQDPNVVSFDRFVLVLDLLYTLGAIELRDGVLKAAQAET